LFEIGSQN